MRKFINVVNGNLEVKKELDNWGLSFVDNIIDVRVLYKKIILGSLMVNFFCKRIVFFLIFGKC